MKYKPLFVAISLGVIIAALGYPVVTILLGMQVDGYSHMRDLISELGVSNLPYAWVLTAVLIVNGLLVIGLAFAVYLSIGEPDTLKLAPILIGVFGVSLLIGGLFPCDANCRPDTFNGWVHVLNFLPSVIATLGAPFMLQRKFAEDDRLYLFATMSFILGVLTVVCVFASMALFPLLSLEGFGQRLVLALQLAFYILVAVSVIHANLRYTIWKASPDASR